MDARRSHQVSHCVEFVVMLESETLEVPQSDLRSDVSIRLLCLGNNGNDLVHLLEQCRIARLGIDVAGGFEPLVDPSVFPVASLDLAFLLARSDEHVVPRPIAGQFP